MNLKEKCIVVGVTGGIAAFKTAQLVSDLVKTGADVRVVMTRAATEFVSPLTFETLTNSKVSVDTFDRMFEWDVRHISLAKAADVFIVAPATANFIAKAANGIADDMLSTTFLAAGCPKIVAPAMNTGMLLNPATQHNIQVLRSRGIAIVEPDSGYLACGDVAKGRLAELPQLHDAIEFALNENKDLGGLHVLVTAGPTCEPMDPVRYITNRSSGKMGYALARAAYMRGARVTLVAGRTNLSAPAGVERVEVFSAQDMFDAVMARAQDADIVIKAAAVGDYRPAAVSDQKIKKSDADMKIELVRNPDILAALGSQKRAGQILCGFSMETQNLVENSVAKLRKKNADIMVANDLSSEGAGFSVDTNIVTLITENSARPVDLMSKAALSDVILDQILELRLQK